jgi:hypothetical protein
MTAVLLVWGIIMYRIMGTMFGNSDGEIQQTERAKPQSAKAAKYVYTDDVRDPFAFFPVARQSAAQPDKKNIPAAQPAAILPPFKLTGIVVGTTSKRTAILERNDGSVYFVGEGDMLDGLIITSIRKESVEYFFNKKKYVWQLNVDL